MKRGRNQRRRPGGNNPNRALDSNGPEVRIRGTASQIYDKYIALARDASSSGDRIKAESYLQHAEHYFRVIRATQPAPQPQQNSSESSEEDQPSLESGGERNDNRSGNDRSGGDRSGGGRNADRRGGRDRNERPMANPVANDESDKPEAEVEAEQPEQPVEAAAPAEVEDEPKPKRKRAKRTVKRAVKEDADAPVAEEPAAAAE